MRTFILFARKARSDSNFSIEDLPGSGGRMDLVARCITAALWLSHNIRDDARIYVVLNGPGNPPVTVCFDGSKIQKVSTDERATAMWIKKMLEEKFDKEWHTTYNGIMVARKSFQDIVKELKDSKFYVLHENGESIGNVKIEGDPVFILGDHLGIPDKDESFVFRYNAEKVSLGKQVYLASSCISVINWVLDQKDIV
jgi:tRNA (pseudouridine54-N1)-methyltransferase